MAAPATTWTEQTETSTAWTEQTETSTAWTKQGTNSTEWGEEFPFSINKFVTEPPT